MECETAYRIGPIKLSAGTLPRHVWAYVGVALANAAMVGFFPLMQPFVLGTQIGLPAELMGRTAGNLAFVQSMAVLVFTVIVGALVDRIGRAQTLALALAIMIGCALVYPLGTSLPILFALMFVLGIAQTGHLVAGATVNMDYPDNASRGTYLSLLTVTSIVGSMLIIGQFAPRIPRFLESIGIDPLMRIRYSFWLMAALALPIAFVARYGLKPMPKPAGSRRTIGGEIASVATGFRTVVAHARQHRPFRFVMLTALTMRADFAVVSTFLSLWIAHEARARGIDQADALLRVGKLYSVVLAGNLVMTLLAGLIIDKVDRRRLIVVALAFVAAGMATPALISDVFAPEAYIVAALLGLAEGAVLVPVYALLGQETPTGLRGTTSGIFSLIGICGVSAINFAGGILFDKAGATSPFLMVAAVNAILFVIAFRFLRGAAPTSA